MAVAGGTVRVPEGGVGIDEQLREIGADAPVGEQLDPVLSQHDRITESRARRA